MLIRAKTDGGALLARAALGALVALAPLAAPGAELLDRGPQVERVKGILRELLSGELDPSGPRAYVVADREWNALAAPDGTLFVFSGLVEALDDDELAIVLGHELAHATQEHARREGAQARGLRRFAGAALAAAGELDDPFERELVQAGALVAAAAWRSACGRALEEQADSVGLRYAWAAGYDVGKAPALWRRFAERGEEQPPLWSYFFSAYPSARERARRLAGELRGHYAAGARPLEAF